jgi:hypothetical protein
MAGDKMQARLFVQNHDRSVSKVKQQQHELCVLINITLKQLSTELANLDDNYSIITEISSSSVTKVDELLLVGAKLGIIESDEDGEKMLESAEITEDVYDDSKSELVIFLFFFFTKKTDFGQFEGNFVEYP